MRQDCRMVSVFLTRARYAIDLRNRGKRVRLGGDACKFRRDHTASLVRYRRAMI